MEFDPAAQLPITRNTKGCNTDLIPELLAWLGLTTLLLAPLVNTIAIQLRLPSVVSSVIALGLGFRPQRLASRILARMSDIKGSISG